MRKSRKRPRPVRALTLGFPNVGKSALINRLVRQKVVDSARRAGVTRTLRWVRLGQSLDLLDAPGVLPPRLDNQQAALHLALCDDIGQAAYDGEGVALAFLEMLVALEQPLWIRAAFKPISTLMKPLRSVDVRTGEESKAAIERSLSTFIGASAMFQVSVAMPSAPVV